MRRLASRLTQLQELVLIFNNPGQQLETRHLASLAALPALSALTLQANFHPEACSFGAALGACSRLTRLTLLPSEASAGLTDSHVAGLAGGLIAGYRARVIVRQLTSPFLGWLAVRGACSGDIGSLYRHHFHHFTCPAPNSNRSAHHLLTTTGLRGLQTLEFPGHARAFTGATLASLAVSLPRLQRLAISSNKPGAVDYTLALPALAGLRALTRRWVG